jgi:hypothetical protein
MVERRLFTVAAKAKSLTDKNVKVIVATGVGLRAQPRRRAPIPLLFASGRKAPAHGDPTANAKAVYLGMSTPNVEDHNRYKRLRELLDHNAHIYQLINKDSPVYVEEGKWSKPLVAGSLAELKSAFQTAVDNKAGALLVSGDPFFNSNGPSSSGSLPSTRYRRATLA